MLGAFDYRPIPAATALTDQPIVRWSLAIPIATLTLKGNRVFAAPTAMAPGTYVLMLKQDATGTRTVTWNSAFKWSAASAPVLSTAANAVDVLSFFCDGLNMYGSLGLRGAA